MNLRERLDASCARRYRTIFIDGVGDLTIQSFSEYERTSILQVSAGSQPKMHCLMVAYALIDPAKNNSRVYSTSDDDLSAIGKLDAAISIPLIDAIEQHCSTLTIEELVKN